jgi:nicotinate-nucleotide adenylyltransferase
MRIGLFGGTFDPPHTGHFRVAEAAVRSLQLDQLVWMPANRSPHKTEQAQTAPTHRLAMASLAAAGHDRFSVSDMEMRRPPPSYMVETLEAFREDHPDATLYLIIGQDSLSGFRSWKSPDRIQELARLAVYARRGDWSDPGLQAGWDWIDAPIIDVSSTHIRSKIRQGLPVTGLVQESVMAYIGEHLLYQS